MINIERGTILRALFSCLALQTWFSGLCEKRSMHFLVTSEAGLFGVLVIGVMGVLGLVLFLDTVVNDMMSANKRFPWALNKRPYVLMGLAVLNAGELFVAAHKVGSLSLSLYCAIMATFLAATAFRDVQIRYRGK